MSRLAEDHPDRSTEELLAESVRSFNCRELVRGFSPMQHVIGRAPDETGRFVSGLTERGREPFTEALTQTVETSAQLQQAAEKALVDWQAQQRVNRAMNSRSRNRIMYHPGDLVYFWRKQVSGRNAGKIGSFQGPARILAMETKRDAEGYPRPGSAIWCVKGRRLLKCAPEQLRPASGREELLEHLSQTIESSAPWTFPQLVASLGGNEYEDLGDDLPSLDQWTAAQEVSQMEGAPRYRHQSKRPLTETRLQFEGDGELEDATPAGAAAKIARSSGSDGYHGDLVDTAWWRTR